MKDQLFQQQKEWKSYINKQLFSCEDIQNWYFASKYTFGNEYWLFSHCIVPIWLLFSGLSSFLLASNYFSFRHFINAFLFGIPIVFIFILYSICPAVNDNLLLYYEFRIKSNFSLLMLFFYVIIAVVEFTIKNQHTTYVFAISTTLLFNLLFFVLSLVSTFWVPKQIQKTKKWQVPDKLERLKGSSPTPPPLTINVSQSFRTVLESSDKIEYLAKHLQSEFCLENLLSFIEMLQFKQCLAKSVLCKFSNEFQEEFKKGIFGIKLPETVPLSIIVYPFSVFHKKQKSHSRSRTKNWLNLGLSNPSRLDKLFEAKERDEEEKIKVVDGVSQKVKKLEGCEIFEDDKTQIENWKEMAKKLCEKYVDIGSRHQINISYDVRRGIEMAQYGGENKSGQFNFLRKTPLPDEDSKDVQLFTLFDGALMTVYRLMKASQGRM